MVIRSCTRGCPGNRYVGGGRRALRAYHGGDANAGAQRNERGRQRNVGLSSVPALCRPFKLSVPPCLETPCKYVKIASVAVAFHKRSFLSTFLFLFLFFSPPPPHPPQNAVYVFFVLFFFPRPLPRSSLLVSSLSAAAAANRRYRHGLHPPHTPSLPVRVIMPPCTHHLLAAVAISHYARVV